MDGATVPLLVIQSSVSPAGNAERVLRVGRSVHGGGCKHKCDKCNYAESYAGPPPPTAATESATPVGTLSATVSGTLNPEGTDAHYSFEYGTTTAYGSKVATADAGAGTTNVKVSDSLNALGPNTTYHYRLVATNAVATTYGADHELHTLGSEWRQAGEPLSAAVGTKWKGTVKLTDEGSSMCPGWNAKTAGEGLAGAGAVDEETKVDDVEMRFHFASGSVNRRGVWKYMRWICRGIPNWLSWKGRCVT